MLTSQMDGVTSAEVSYENKKGVFEFDEAKVKKEDLVKSMKELGYTATEASA
jgi:copper chaperone CopZ